MFCDPVVTLIPIAVTEDVNDHLLAPTTAMADVTALVMYGHKDQSLCIAPNNCEKRVQLNDLAQVIEDLRFAGVEHAARLTHHNPIV